MKILENISLKPLNTFRIESKASRFGEVRSLADIEQVSRELMELKLPLLVLGGGSNLLLCNDFDGLVVKMSLPGIDVVSEDEDHVIVKVGSGVVWHELVLYCVDHGYAGIENLALIPGLCGAAPMQNIGAYGVEIKDVLVEVEAWDIQNSQLKSFSNEDCQFGYRESIFKNSLRNKFVITSISLRLSKRPILNTSYGAIEQELKSMNVTSPNLRDVSNAVINIRRSKLPDPAVIGNAGSFFKNPIVDEQFALNMLSKYDEMPIYDAGPGTKKIAAGWMIEKAGWKGLNRVTHGVHNKQALVLVNFGGATGDELFRLSQDIIEDIQEKFGIVLEREVNVI